MGCSVMSELKVDTIVNLAGTGKPNLPVSPTLGGTALSSANTYSYTSSGTEPSSPKNGAIWWDSSNSEVYLYIAGEFKKVTLNAAAASGIDWGGARGIWTGGNEGSGRSNRIQYAAIATPGNTSDFGDLTASREWSAACSNGSRSIVAGGYDGATSASTDIIDYFATATTANAQDFGNLLRADRFKAACSDGASNTDRGLIMGGGATNYEEVIEYVVITNTGNSSDFGDLTGGRRYLAAAASATRGVFMGGLYADEVNTIDYVTISTAGNATDFGDLLQIVRGGAASSDTTRILHSGGYANNTDKTNTIQYITTATAGNATDFGDATVTVERHGACSDGTYHVNGGGYNSSNARINNMDYVTIQTLGNAQDFGDLLAINSGVSSSSGAAS